MMKKLMLLLTVILLSFPVLTGAAQKLGEIPELMKPGMLEVDDNKLYVVQGATVHVFSLENLKEIHRFGKKGEGPGELPTVPRWNNRLLITPDAIYMEGERKIIRFDKQGNFLSETRKPFESAMFIPVGKNFIAKKHRLEKQKSFMLLSLYDADMKEIKELYRQEFVQQPNPGGGVKIDLFGDMLNVGVIGDKIFIDKSPEGFVLDVLNSSGKKLYRIQKEVTPLKVTAAHKETAIELVKQDPLVRERIKRFGSWANLKKVIHFHFSPTKPAIRDFLAADGKLYARTFKEKEGKEEYIIMNPKGNLLRTAWVPRVVTDGLKDRLTGVRRWTIRNGNMYYLLENETTETWELFTQPVG